MTQSEMAAATIQRQAREIEKLQRDVRNLKHENRKLEVALRQYASALNAVEMQRVHYRASLYAVPRWVRGLFGIAD